MSNKYKLIATDFDGTLLDDNHKVSKRNIATLLKYKSEGYKIVGATGRTLGGVKNIIDINIFDYLILNNGGCIYDVNNKKVDYQIVIPKDIVAKITKELEEYVYQIDYCSINSYYTYKNKKNSPLDFIIDIDSLDEIKEEVTKINLFLLDNDNIEKLCENINKNYNLYAFLMQDSNNDLKILTINPKGINKKNTLEKLGDFLNIPKESMIFFGDGLNDLEIIEWVGCGVAVENAFEEVKKKASAITKSNNDDGVAVFLEKILN